MRGDGGIFHLVMIDGAWPPHQLQKLNKFISDWARTRKEFEPKPDEGVTVNYCTDPVKADHMLQFFHGQMKHRRDFVALRSDAFSRGGAWSFEIELAEASGSSFARTWQLAVALAVADYAACSMDIKVWVEALFTEDPKHAERVAEFLADAGRWRNHETSAHQDINQASGADPGASQEGGSPSPVPTKTTDPKLGGAPTIDPRPPAAPPRAPTVEQEPVQEFDEFETEGGNTDGKS